MSKCLQAVHAQDTDKSIEVLVIDNETPDIKPHQFTSQYPKLKWLSNHVKNPYDSRNKGVAEAKGKYLAFIDTKCVPRSSWISNGLKVLESDKNIIVVGRYNVIPFSEKLKDKLYGLLYLNNQKNVQKSYGVTFGNLFLKKSDFIRLGNFDTTHISGNDIKWTRNAISQGMEIKYVPEAIVDYHGQSYEELKGSIGKYISGITHQEEMQQISFLRRCIKGSKFLFPMRKSTFVTALKYRDLADISTMDKYYLYVKIWRLKLIMAKNYFLK